MIMHGDGHGGVHHHDGFLDVNGIFEGRFDIILTNPPFGANVEPSDVVHESDVRCQPRGGEAIHRRLWGPIHRSIGPRPRRCGQADCGKPLSIFPKARTARPRPKSFSLSVAWHCLSRVANSASSYPRAFSTIPHSPMFASSAKTVPTSAPLLSLPQETFISSGASVKASLLFVQKFSEKEQAEFGCQT